MKNKSSRNQPEYTQLTKIPSKTKELNGNRGLRIPRPTGVTELSRQIRREKTKEVRDKLKKYLIRTLTEQWTNTNMQLNQRMLTINQLSQYLNTTEDTITKYMYLSMKRAGRWFDEGKGIEIARATFTGALKKGLEFQALCLSQTEILMRSQDGKYRPFISGEVNRAIGNLVGSQKPVHDLIHMMFDAKEKNPIINFNYTDNSQHNELHVTNEQALKLINSNSPSMLEDPHLADAQIAKYQKAGLLPDVNARSQDLTAIGIRHKGILNPDTLIPINPMANPMPNPDKSSKKSRDQDHTERVGNPGIAEVMNEEDFRL